MATLRVAKLCSAGISVTIGDTFHDRDKVRALYSSHRVFCLPKLYPVEAQPRSILGSMANRCAVIATRFRSIPEQVLDGETGVLVANQDPDHIADRVTEFMDCDLPAMGQPGRYQLGKHFGRDAIRAKLLEAFDTEVS